MINFIKAGCVCFIFFFLLSCQNKEPKQANKETVPKLPVEVQTAIEQIQAYPEDSTKRIALIEILDSLKDYRNALKQLDTLIKKDSNNTEFWYKQGKLFKNLGDTTQAINSFVHSVGVYPQPNALLELANLFAERKDKRTLLVCKQIDEMHIGRMMDSYTQFFAGVYFARTGNKKQAIDYFNSAINLNYNFIDPLLEKGYIYFDNKDYSKALQTFQTAASINSTSADANYWIGRCFENLGQKTEALEKYEKSLVLDSQLLEAKSAIKRLQNTSITH